MKNNTIGISYNKKLDKFSLNDNFLLTDVDTNFPLSIGWIITGKCNLKCLHCYGNEEELPKDEISKKEALLIAKKIVDAGIYRVSISGGEPMLRNDLIEIVTFLSNNGVSVIVSTNGLNVKEKIQGLKNLRHIEFSLDGSNLDIHNRFRPSRIKGSNESYENAISGIKEAVKNGLKTRVLTTLSIYNYKNIKEIGSLLTDLGVDEWHIGKSVNAGRARFIYDELNKGVHFDENDLYKLQKEFSNLKIQFNFPSKSSNYYALILPNGIVSTQDTNTGEKIELGSIVENEISDYWNKDNFDIMGHYIKWLNIKP